MKSEKLEVQKRTILGKKVKNLRKEGILPANIYGKTQKSAAVQMDLKAFEKVFEHTGQTGLVDVVFGKDTIPSLIQNIQKDPRTKTAIHADFLAVNLKEKRTAKISVVSLGEAPAVHDKKGELTQALSELEVEALPSDLPEHIEVSLESLKEVNDHISVSDIKAAGNYTIITDPELVVFKISEIRIQEEPEPTEESGEEVQTEEGGEETKDSESSDEKPTEEKASE